MPADCRRSPVERAQKWGAGVLIAGYLGATFWHLALYAFGDVGNHPLAYFFVWDMFPSHTAWSFQRVAVGRTSRGELLQIVPSGQQQFREGIHGDRTRADLERSGAFFRPIAERTLEVAGPSLEADPVVELQLYEVYWPAKFNYSPELYERWAGVPKPDRRYWRLRERVTLDAPKAVAPPGSRA